MSKAVRPTTSQASRRRRVARILEALDQAYPDAECALRHRDPLELLIATILSAQCTDERVNAVTRELFEVYRTPDDYARAPIAVLEQQIRPTGFFRNKARSIQATARMLIERFGARVPQTMAELVQLPGVARKTANVVLGVAFGKAEGVVVDTHVFRTARRLDLSRAEVPEKVEQDLMAVVPRDRWISLSHQLIHHGRRVCKARRPLCGICPVENLCESPDKMLAFTPSPVAADSP
jgi:endonuclease-3